MAEQQQPRQQRRQFDPLSVTPLREAGRYRFWVVAYTRDRARAHGEHVTLAVAGQPNVHAVTDANGEAYLYVTFPSTATAVVSGMGETKSFPDLPGFANVSTNIGRPSDKDIEGNIFSAMARMIQRARAKRRVDTGRR